MSAQVNRVIFGRFAECLLIFDSGGIADPKPLLGAMWGRLRVGKDFFTPAGLAGAAMCSAFERGSRDRWP